jgi:hypothetical protein
VTRDWFAAREPYRLLDVVRNHPPADADRRMRLFAAACVRQVWHLLPTDTRSAILVSERFADGDAGEADLLASLPRLPDAAVTAAGLAGSAAAWAAGVTVPIPNNAPAERVLWDQGIAATYAARAVASWRAGPAPSRVGPDWHARWHAGHAAALAVQADLVRDIFHPPGTPPPTLDPDWLTSAVRQLADALYESRDFVAMPVLADALQDAGCADAAILGHCRGPGPHVRGCWVVDLIRGA